jgi:probable F420-dependent oxidoreductase
MASPPSATCARSRCLAKAGRSRDDFEISYPSFVVTGETDEAMEKAAVGTRQQIAFYGSTPAYRPVLELHGWGDLQTELNGLSKQGEWVKMGELIDDDVMNAFAVVASPDEVPKALANRFGNAVDRVSFYTPYASDPARWRQVLDALKAAG